MKKIVLFAFAACILAACTPKEFSGSESLPTPKVFTAGIESTRTFVDNYNVCWSADDAISIFDKNTGNAKYAYAGTEGETKGDFVLSGSTTAGSDLPYVYAVYPYDANNSIDANGNISVTIPNEQEYVPDSFAEEANIMVAVSEDESLLFKNVCGYLNLRLYGDEAAQVYFVALSGNNSEVVAGKGTVSASVDGNPTFSFGSVSNYATYVYDDNGAIVLGTSSSKPVDLWFALPPTKFTKGISVYVYTMDGREFEYSSSNPLEIKRGVCTSTRPLKVTLPSLVSDDVVDDVLAGSYTVSSSSVPYEGYDYEESLELSADSDSCYQFAPISQTDFSLFTYDGNVVVEGELGEMGVTFYARLMDSGQLIIPSGTLVNYGDLLANYGIDGTYYAALFVADTDYYYYTDDIIINVTGDHKLSLDSSNDCIGILLFDEEYAPYQWWDILTDVTFTASVAPTRRNVPWTPIDFSRKLRVLEPAGKAPLLR